MRAFAVGDFLVRLVTPSHLRDAIVGDLHERFRAVEEAQGTKAARHNYYQDLFASLPSLRG